MKKINVTYQYIVEQTYELEVENNFDASNPENIENLEIDIEKLPDPEYWESNEKIVKIEENNKIIYKDEEY
jgi:hypothetical protein